MSWATIEVRLGKLSIQPEGGSKSRRWVTVFLFRRDVRQELRPSHSEAYHSLGLQHLSGELIKKSGVGFGAILLRLMGNRHILLLTAPLGKVLSIV